MKHKLKILLWIFFWSATAFSTNPFPQQNADSEAAVTPVRVDGIVYARPFALSKGYQWSSVDDEPQTDVGYIVVLRVDPKLVVPSNALSPILYAGDRMLQALNFGHTSGHVIGLVPGQLDLSETPFWFGSPTTPRRVTPESIRAEQDQARKAGIRAFTPEQIESVTQPAIVTTDLNALLRGELADLVLQYAPEEGDLARKWRLPEAKVGQDPAVHGAVKPERQKREQK